MQAQIEHYSSGIPALDRHLESLLLGDNVVWVGDDPAVHTVLETSFLAEANDSVLVLLDGETPALPTGTLLVDARPGRPHADPVELERIIVERGRRGARMVIRDLDTLVRRFGEERAVGFFSRTCPRLFDQGAIAYWRATRTGSGKILEAVQRVTQCVLEFSNGRLRFRKSEGHPGAAGKLLDLYLSEDGSLELAEVRAASRLAEGLRQLRAERGLTQTEVARLAGVSPSAISQAEAGHRGLGVETLLALSEAAGVSLDTLFGHSPDTGYVLARRDRIPPRRGVVALLDDPGAGLRAHLVTLGGGEAGGPPVVHKGAELIMVSLGLVQIELNEETPVMRAGDALLVTRDAIAGWRNLLPEPARLFWIVRD